MAIDKAKKSDNSMGSIKDLVTKGLSFNLSCGQEKNKFDENRIDLIKLGFNSKFDSYRLGITSDGYELKAKVLVFATPIKSDKVIASNVGGLSIG